MELIAQYGTVFIVLAIIFGFYMSWGIGANAIANAMGTSVGSGAISVRQAIVIAAIFEFSGALIAGGNVTNTIRNGIIDPSVMTANPEVLVLASRTGFTGVDYPHRGWRGYRCGTGARNWCH